MGKLSIFGTRGVLAGPPLVSESANGALIYTDNIVVRQLGVYEPRRGIQVAGADASTTLDSIWYDPNSQLVYRAARRPNNGLEKFSSATWTSVSSSYCFGDATPFRQFFYLLSNEGLKKVNSGNTGVEIGYVPEALDAQLAVTGASGFLANNTQIAYRICWGVKNARNEFFLGAPSGRATLINTAGGTRDVTVTLTVPDNWRIVGTLTNTSPTISAVGATDFQELQIGMSVYHANVPAGTTITALNAGAGTITMSANATGSSAGATIGISWVTLNHFYQVYRTNYSSGVAVPPDDEMFLVYEAYPVAGSFTAGTIAVTDQLPQGGGGPLLYTNPSQEGPAQANSPCEAAHNPASSVNTPCDLTTFANCMWAIPYRPRSALVINLLGVGTPVGVQNGDTLTIAGVVYTGGAAENIATGTFLVSTGGTTAENIQATAQSLVRVINRYLSTKRVRAAYISGIDDLPGRILIQAVSDRASTYTATASRATSWYPNMATAQTILSEPRPTRIVFSKANNPQAWPALNFRELPNQAIPYALTALRGALLIWTDRGLYRITGGYGAFNLDVLDESVRYYATPTWSGAGGVVFENKAYVLCEQGLVAATETSSDSSVSGDMTNINRDIKPEDGQLFIFPPDGHLFVPGPAPSSTAGTLVYHTREGLWTRWAANYRDGAYDEANHQLYLIENDTNTRSMSLDFLQNGGPFTSAGIISITNILSTTSVQVASVPAGLSIGDVIVRGSTTSTITAINGTVLSLVTSAGMTIGAGLYFVGFDVELVYGPTALPNPSDTKLARYTQLVLDALPAYSGADDRLGAVGPTAPMYTRISYSSDVLDTFSSDVTDFVPISKNGTVWRFGVPKEYARFAAITVRLRMRICLHIPRILGIQIDAEGQAERTRR